MSVQIVMQWIVFMLSGFPNHELMRSEELREEVATYFVESARMADDDPMRFLYYAEKESSLLIYKDGKLREGKLGEIGYGQFHGVARNTCEAAGYDLSTRKGGAYCIGLLMDMGMRRCGTPVRRDGWYMSGKCSKANEKAVNRDNAFNKKKSAFFNSINQTNEESNSVIVEGSKMDSGKSSKVLGCNDGLPGVTCKLDVGHDSIYVHTVWFNGRLSYLDVTLSRGDTDGDNILVGAESISDLGLKKFDLARSWVEDSCKLASMLLDRGMEVEELVSHWKGRIGYPSGICPQLQSIVPGPLHATAMLIERNIEKWRLEFGEIN